MFTKKLVGLVLFANLLSASLLYSQKDEAELAIIGVGGVMATVGALSMLKKGACPKIFGLLLTGGGIGMILAHNQIKYQGDKIFQQRPLDKAERFVGDVAETLGLNK